MEIHSVDISCRGAVLIGEKIAVDGHEPHRVRIITHAHSDHMVDIDESIRSSPRIFAHPATFEIMDILGISIPSNKAFKVDYGGEIHLEDGILKFLRSKHILGSIQTYYVSREGVSVVYTGDFKEPGSGTEIRESDIVITEATYGSPEYIRPYKDIIDELLADFVSELISRGPLIIKAYYGKQQEVMEVLRKGGIAAPYIAGNKVYMISKVAEKYGAKIGDLFLEGTREAEEIIKQGWYIYFTHTSSRKNSITIGREHRHTVLYLSGWERELYRMIDRNTYVFSYSGHSDFEDLIVYIDRARPKYVIVDAYRSGENAKKFSKYLEERLKIKASYRPVISICY
ncbi:MAG: MBL fold metallo-hydrolase [Desulfurococcales archaeon]|nr:MBL fold metallo-hydrolase [Desulfurococcales archaeon]